jgi:hypothetical protein
MENAPTINPICPGDPPRLSKNRGRRLNVDKDEKAINTRKCMARITRGKVLSSIPEINLFMGKGSYSG